MLIFIQPVKIIEEQEKLEKLGMDCKLLQKENHEKPKETPKGKAKADFRKCVLENQATGSCSKCNCTETETVIQNEA